MSAKKKVLAAASYVMVAALAVGGTVAYLADTDKDVNVMTYGNVSIDQHEYQRVVDENGDYAKSTFDGQDSYVLEAFEQGKMLMPATNADNHGAGDWDTTTVRMSQVDSYGGMSVFENENAVDKFVTVENTGRSDAYVRTLVAVEVGSADADLIGTSYHQTWTSNQIGTITIEGCNYYLTEYVYKGGQLSDGTWRHENGILPAHDTSYPSLAQVYLQSKATSEDVEKLDANGNGTLDIYVLSQAVQADGFETADAAFTAAFGDVATNATAWFEAEDVVTASPAAGAVRPAGYIPSTEGEVIDHLVINDNSDENTNLRALYNGEGGSANYTTDDIYIMNSYLDGTYAMNLYAVDGSGAKLVVSDTALLGWVSYTGFASAEFTNCTFDINSEGQYKTIRPYDTSVFTNCDFAADYQFLFDMLGAGDTVTFENCTIGGVAITASTFDASAPVVIK